ncbi:hypothetical protein WJX72_008863 [[Myrmecia] bisecta]|uniref:Sugar phosphate transporter domain-containing protein n=1 Tax=[Myrmecia] bisecta TaxID=41462 RepID=A0AAW1QRV0_9CHLO
MPVIAEAGWQQQAEEQRISKLLWGGGSALLYGGTAIAMNFVNKAALREFPLANAILLFQMLSAIAVIYPLKAVGAVKFPPLSLAKAWGLLPVTLLYVSNVGFALVSLQSLNVPMYNTLKRLTPVLVLSVKAVLTKRWPPWKITASVLLVVSGCVVAGLGDLSFDLKGYMFAFTSCMLQASYLLLVERSGVKNGVGTTELLLYNAVLSVPFLVGVLVWSGEAWQVAPSFYTAAESVGPITAPLLIGACATMGMLLNYAMFLCTMHNSALTTTIVGVLKGAVATLLGFFLLGGVKFHVLNVLGIAINTGGGAWYTLIKYQQRQSMPQRSSGPNVADEEKPLLSKDLGRALASPTRTRVFDSAGSIASLARATQK